MFLCITLGIVQIIALSKSLNDPFPLLINASLDRKDLNFMNDLILGLYSQSGRTFHLKISWSLESEIGSYNDRIAPKFDRWQLGSATVEVPVKFQSDCKSLSKNLVVSRRREILQ